MQRKLAAIDARMPSILGDDDKQEMPKIREILRMVGNMKANTPDEARRTTRIIGKLRDKSSSEVVLESDDLAYLQKCFEANPMGLTAWMQGNMLDILEGAEKVEPKP